MAISTWRGKFNSSSGRITIDRTARTGTVNVVIDTASIDFGLDAMNEKARSEDFFDVANHPTATYQGTLDFVGDEPKAVDGQVTIMGVTRRVNLAIHLFKCIPHPSLKKELCGPRARLAPPRRSSQSTRRWRAAGPNACPNRPFPPASRAADRDSLVNHVNSAEWDPAS